MASMQLTEGNPNIVDLSDQNRPDKIAEQFSELYDNQWTECYQDLVNVLKKTEEESIHILLQIVKTSYNICLDRSRTILTDAKDSMFVFAGKSDGDPDKALDALIQETLHKLKYYRTKNFKAAPTNIEEEIMAKLISLIGESEIDLCGSFIEECIRICWLMCIKDPPMYIVCDKETLFDKTKYVAYTRRGNNVSFVVWPVLCLHKNGPLMKQGVAQGEDREEQKGNTKVNPASPSLLEVDHMQGYHTNIENTTKLDSDYPIKDPFIAKETNPENMESVDSSLLPIKMEDTADGNKGKSEQLGFGDHEKIEPTDEDVAMRQKYTDAVGTAQCKGHIITAMIENEAQCKGNYNDVEQFKEVSGQMSETQTFNRAAKTDKTIYDLKTTYVEKNEMCRQGQSNLNGMEEISAICHARRGDNEDQLSHDIYKPENNAIDVPKEKDNLKYPLDSVFVNDTRSTEDNQGSTTDLLQETDVEGTVVASITK